MPQAALEPRVDRLEEALMEMVYQSRKTEMELERLCREMRDFKIEMQDFKNEMQDFKNEMQDFKEEMRGFKNEMNKKWGDLANRLGTLAEDIVAPGVSQVLRQDFDLEVEDLSVRRRKRREGRSREVDVIAVAGRYCFVVDVKATYRREYLDEFSQLLEEFPVFFPEYVSLKLVPVIASLNLTEEIVTLATRSGWLALQLSGGYLEFVNKDRVPLPE